VNGRLLPRAELTGAQRAAMSALMQAHFDGVTPAQFAADLAEKNWVILLEDGAGKIRGFSTMLVYESVVVPARVVYSGDTIVDRAVWGSNVLARTWIAAVRQLEAEYWLLITSGFRTYRFLSVFWWEFWPRNDAPRRPALLDALARERFGERYADGIVRFKHPQRLRNALAEIPAGRKADPHTAFFAMQNPGWMDGDELVCLCELSSSNLTPAGERMVCARECVST
jgi:hypothetical protein